MSLFSEKMLQSIVRRRVVRNCGRKRVKLCGAIRLRPRIVAPIDQNQACIILRRVLAKTTKNL
jgi:hypothetical protein